MRGKRARNRTDNQGQGGIKSPQSIKPETVTQSRANFREIKGAGGKKSEIGGKNAKSAAIRTKSGVLPHKTRATLENRHPAQLQQAENRPGRSWYPAEIRAGQLVPGTGRSCSGQHRKRSGTRRSGAGFPLYRWTEAAPGAAGTRRDPRGRSCRRSGNRQPRAAGTRCS